MASRKIQTYQNKAKNLCTISFLCLTWTVNANSLKQNIIVIKEICSWLPPFCKQNLLLFIQPKWQTRQMANLNSGLRYINLADKVDAKSGINWTIVGQLNEQYQQRSTIS